MLKQQLARELQKSTTRKLEKQKVHSCFIESSWVANLTDIQLISDFNKRFDFVLC